MIEYKWEVTDIKRNPDNGFVVSTSWKLTATEGDRSEVATGHCGFEFDSTRPVIPFEELTEETVLSWIWACGFGKVDNEEFLANKFSEEVVTVVTPISGKPWEKEEPLVIEEPMIAEELMIAEEPLVIEEPTVL